LNVWFEKGQRLGEHIRMHYPTLDSLGFAVTELQKVLPVKRAELRRVAGKPDGRSRFVLRLVADLSQPMTNCVERMLEGVLTAYRCRPEESRVVQGILEITVVQETAAGRGTDAEEGFGETDVMDPKVA
jgi:hypothetical protein